MNRREFVRLSAGMLAILGIPYHQEPVLARWVQIAFASKIDFAFLNTLSRESRVPASVLHVNRANFKGEPGWFEALFYTQEEECVVPRILSLFQVEELDVYADDQYYRDTLNHWKSSGLISIADISFTRTM